MEIWVSNNYLLDTVKHTCQEKGSNSKIYKFDDKKLHYLIFKDRMEGWFFKPALALLEENESVAAIHIVTPLIEALEERYRGEQSKSKSRCFFCRRANIIFDLKGNKEALNLLHQGLRCGFAHHGFLKDDGGISNILIANEEQALKYQESGPILWVNAEKYVDGIHKAYADYYNELKTNSELQSNFSKIWNMDWQMSFRVPGGCGSVSEGT